LSVPSPTGLASKNVSVNIVDLIITHNSAVHGFNKFIRRGHLRLLGIDHKMILIGFLKELIIIV
jgi:hypothetical protein